MVNLLGFLMVVANGVQMLTMRLLPVRIRLEEGALVGALRGSWRRERQRRRRLVRQCSCAVGRGGGM